MTITPIETRYAGCRFRSRLEARWAVFFDSLGIEWLYEPEGYVLEGGQCYLPDFLIHPNTDQEFWFEAKGTHPTLEELDKAQGLAEGTGTGVYVYFGKLEAPMRHITPEDNRDSVPGTLWVDREGWVKVDIPRWELEAEPTAFHRFPPSDPSIWPWRPSGESYFYWWSDCIRCGHVSIRRRGQVLGCKACSHSDPSHRHNTPRLLEAYRAARSARFEHGENG